MLFNICESTRALFYSIFWLVVPYLGRNISNIIRSLICGLLFSYFLATWILFNVYHVSNSTWLIRRKRITAKHSQDTNDVRTISSKHARWFAWELILIILNWTEHVKAIDKNVPNDFARYSSQKLIIEFIIYKITIHSYNCITFYNECIFILRYCYSYTFFFYSTRRILFICPIRFLFSIYST